MIKTAAGILVGGKSSRMGRNKASLTWNGNTFLHTLIEACRDFPEIYVSVDDRSKYQDLSCTVVEDEERGYGPLEGIYQILKQMDAPYAVMLATDMPMISPEFLQALVSRLTGEEDCLVLRKEGRPQPLCSVYAKRILPTVEKMRRDREHKPGLLFQRVNTRYVDLEELGFGEAVIANVNTPEEYEQLCFCYGRRLQEFAPFVREKLSHGKVLVCYLDGVGYRMYKSAADKGSVPFMSRSFSVIPVRTVEPPVTNPAMATMITGELPVVHGVYSRKDRELRVPTLFANRSREDTAFLEGDTRILKTELPPRLHAAAKGKGCDHWIYQAACRAAKDGKEFIFAHFHEIDDAAHGFGPYSSACMEKLQEADRYIEELSKIFSGEILLISDHGMHETRDGGNHGETVCPSDEEDKHERSSCLCAAEDKHERSSCLYAAEDKHERSSCLYAAEDRHERSSCLYAMEDMLAIWGERI